MSLKRRALQAVRWTAIGAAFTSVFKVVQVAFLARLLAPADYGLMAVVTVILGIGTVFSDFGLSNAYLQSRDVTPRQRSSLYWASVGTGAMLTALVLALSPALAAFFQDQRLAPLFALSSSVFILGALSQQLRVDAQKQLSFGRLVALELSSLCIGFLVSVFMALKGWGVYALVWGTIATTLVTSALSWALLAAGWRPQPRFMLEDILPFLKFGSASVGSNIVGQMNMTLDLLIGGRILDASQLGLFSVPRNFMLHLQFLVNPVITRVGFPLIAEIQEDVPRVRNIYLKTVSMTASFNAPIYIAIALFPEDVIHILLGGNWSEAVEMLRVLAIWGLLRSIANPAGSLLLGMGKPGLSLIWNLCVLIVSAPALWIGATQGGYGLVWVLALLQVALVVPVWFFLVRPLCDATLLDYINAFLRPGMLSIVALLPAYLAAHSVEGAFARLAVAGLIAAPLYLTLSYFWNRSWFTATQQMLRL